MDGTGVESRSVDLHPDGDRVRNGEVEVAYRVAGEGPPVVLLHGIGLDSATVSWRHTVPALAETHRVYAPDFPGHGDSERPRERYTTRYYLEVLEEFLSALDVGEPSLVGISMGGCVALGHALERDGDLDRLVCVDSYGLGSDAPWRPAASTLLGVPGAYRSWWRTIGSSRESVRRHVRELTAGEPSADLVEDVYRTVQEASGVRALSSWQRSEFRYDGLRTCYRGRLGELDAPTLFVHGVADPLLPASWSRHAAEETGGSLELFDDCGHWPTREAPERFNDVLRAFL